MASLIVLGIVTIIFGIPINIDTSYSPWWVSPSSPTIPALSIPITLELTKSDFLIITNNLSSLMNVDISVPNSLSLTHTLNSRKKQKLDKFYRRIRT